MNEKQYLVLLSSFVPFGTVRLNLLLDYFKSAKNVWLAPKEKLLLVGLKEGFVEKFLSYKKNLNEKEYFFRLKKLGVSYVTRQENLYPENLEEIEDAPYTLYFKGRLKRKETAVAIVGTRKMTTYGEEVAKEFASKLAKKGITIVSGLARGVDSAAHKAALEVKGRTIAVLPCGLTRVYPSENEYLAREIVTKGGALVSEYPLDFPITRENFRQRNRIISGLVEIVVVVEGEKKSGTLITASAAANQGRTVFAVPGQITSILSQAPHFLIQNGARIAFGVDDILEELKTPFVISES
jgi:DNA processing protein